MYAINVKHNHEIDPMVFVNTSQFVSTKIVPTPIQSEGETITATIKQPAAATLNADLKEKLKQRFAILNKKLQKH